MRGFKSAGHAQRFLSAFGIITSHFRVGRHLSRANGYRAVMKSRFAVWLMLVGPIAGIFVLAATFGHPTQSYVDPNQSASDRTEWTPGQANRQDLRRLCNRITEIKIMPPKGDRGEDKVFDEFMDAGDAVVPCLIKKVVDSTKLQGCPICPGYAGIEQRVGDVAFFILLHMKELTADKFLPDDVRKDYKDWGIYAYFKYVQQPAHRKNLQDKLNVWYQTQYRKSAPLNR